MPNIFQNELYRLEKYILNLGALVEERLNQAVESIKNIDRNLAEKIIENDKEIDQKEVELEEECLKLLALYQPVAIDLRFIIVVLKINNDLERIGDLVVNICECAIFLSHQPDTQPVFDFSEMSEKVKKMLKMSLDSLVNMDLDVAKQVCKIDSKIDEMNRNMYEQVEKGIMKHPEHVKIYLYNRSISKHLERIADLATNIAEDVIYMIEGEIVRHKGE
ncbi:MAG: phosphate signaling complex protein PhoU [bacterium]